MSLSLLSAMMCSPSQRVETLPRNVSTIIIFSSRQECQRKIQKTLKKRGDVTDIFHHRLTMFSLTKIAVPRHGVDRFVGALGDRFDLMLQKIRQPRHLNHQHHQSKTDEHRFDCQKIMKMSRITVVTAGFCTMK